MTAKNRLSSELSPYLRQHADNPVDWYPWGDEALSLARSTRRPILLSIGYSACHWCHVMARESFADPAIAAVMNDNFVNIKVDREERPDVDAIYMSAVQTMTGGGGWPLTVFLTPEGEPFYGGTYFPPTDRGGTPSFRRVLESLARAWNERHDEVRDSAAQLTAHLRALEVTFGRDAARPVEVTRLVSQAVAALAADEDAAGGFGGAPKFPPHAALALLQAVDDKAAAALAERTLDAMAAGGIHDHLGGGFFRYSVDRYWRLPHFEKMLADNAQLLRAYAAAARAEEAEGGGDRHRQVVERLVAWLVSELAVSDLHGAVDGGSASGPDSDADEIAFYTAIDADSQGEEGRFYAWTEAEFREVVAAEVGAEAANLAADYFGVTAAGTFEGGNVLYRAATVAELAQRDSRAPAAAKTAVAVETALRRATAALGRRRRERVRPATDDKVVTSLNGLTLLALAEAGRTLGDEGMLRLAGRVARFLRRHVWLDGRLLHVWRGGVARVDGLLEDYAFVGLGLLAYYRATFETWALTWAFELADQCEARFADRDGGGYFTTAADADPLLVRPKGQTDGATPSESVAASELVWWAARYRSDDQTAERALSGLRDVGEGIGVAPQAFASGLRLLALTARPRREVVIVAGTSDATDLVSAFRAHDDGTAVVLVVTSQDELAGLPLLEGRLVPQGGEARAYVCHDGVCDLPVSDGSALSGLMRSR